MSNSHTHPYHLVDESPWPVLRSLIAFFVASGFIFWFHYSITLYLRLAIGILIFTAFQWWNRISLERTFQGLHTRFIQIGLRWGIVLFIVSEILFFFSFFWAYFFLGVNSRVWMGASWPPLGLLIFNPLQVPLLNTIILLRSGVTVTWAHHRLLENNFHEALIGLSYTIFLGVYFSILQAYEYWEASFTIRDSAYGSCFFLITGFHGFHVFVGTLFLARCWVRLKNFHFRFYHHFIFEAAAWYWHFVDVVWLFLYIRIYWWGNIL